TINTNGKAIQGTLTTLTIQSGTLILTDTSGTPGTNTYAGVTDVGGGTLELGVGGTLGTGAVTGSGGTLRVNRATPLTLGNALTNSVNLTVTGGAAVTLTNTGNTFTGAVNVLNGSLIAGAAGALPAAALVTLGDGTLNTPGVLDINGLNSSVGGLSSAGTGANRVTNSSATADATLTVNGTGTFGGVIQNGPTH